MSELEKKNTKLMWVLVLVAVAMFGFAYIMAAYFEEFCELVGIKRVPIETSREIDVRFITLLDGAIPIKFWTEQPQIMVQPGKYYTVNFYAENKTDRTLITQANADFSPKQTAQFFEKTQCFCFTRQELKPHEVKKMPMRFTVKPELPSKYQFITLSYTFFDNTDKSQ